MEPARPVIDLRSDTVTVPTPPVRAAMAAAEVGDDVYGEDPSVNRLEERTAELLGKEAALFVASGTMANLVSLLTHTRPGDEVIADADAHFYWYEAGGFAVVGGLTTRLVPAERGILHPEQVEALVRADDVHFPRSRLVVIENTHNRGGGTAYTVDEVCAVAEVCRARGLRLHMDGARLFNACVATGAEPAAYAGPVDSVCICLSKGLGCPVGALVAGDDAFIGAARKWRKRLGGGMRQAGILAAAGLYALDHHVDRLADDHANARRLADAVRECPGLELVHDPPETNMVYFRTLPPLTARALAQAAAEHGVRMDAMAPDTVRAVTHIGITAGGVDHVADVLRLVARFSAPL